MKVEIEKKDKLKRVIKIEASGEEFVSERNAAYLEIGKNLKVSGFRPGSAPLEVLEKHHAKILQEEFFKKILPFYYEKAVKENNLSPAGLPRIYDVEINSKSIRFSAEFDVKPELEIKESDYKGIAIKDKKVEVNEQEIEKILSHMKEGIKKFTNRDLNDEELAKWAGYAKTSDFREAIKSQIYIEKLQERRKSINGQLTRHLLKNIKVDLPREEVERCHKELIEREIYNLRLRDIPEDDIEKYKKDIEGKLRPLAEDELRLFYILEAISHKESIKAENNLGEVILGFLLSLARYE
jgi:FKBP-type peptidyl-prolyl cis-trans isomerase (trigger factor)